MRNDSNERQIVLAVKRSTFRRDDPSAEMADAGFKAVRQQVLDRDNYRCHFCDFRAEKYQEVHHVNDDHSNNDPNNLITVCTLCHQDHHLGLAGVNSSGSLIYLEDDRITQADINCIVRDLWIGEQSRDKSIKTASMNMLARFHKLSIDARRKLGTSDPVVLGDYLLNLDDAEYAHRNKALKGVFLLPIRDYFEPRIAYWDKAVYRNIPPHTWLRLAESKAEKIFA